MARPTFPRTLAEFQARFADEAACRAYLAASRWPDGYRCPRCGHTQAFELPRRGLWQCKACGHQTSVTAGTVLHRSRTSLREWFWAAYLVTTHTPGMSALQLQRQLGIPRYETAWTLLQKLRRAMPSWLLRSSATVTASLRRPAVVVVEPAQHREGHDGPAGVYAARPVPLARNPLPDPLVRSASVEVSHPFG